MNVSGVVIALCALVLASGAAKAAGSDGSKSRQCFRSENYQSFRPVNDHAFNIRVNMRDYYRIDLEGSCPTITEPGAILITHVRGSDLICDPLDWDLHVRESGSGGVAIGCIVKSQRQLTAEEVAAIPPREKP